MSGRVLSIGLHGLSVIPGMPVQYTGRRQRPLTMGLLLLLNESAWQNACMWIECGPQSTRAACRPWPLRPRWPCYVRTPIPSLPLPTHHSAQPVAVRRCWRTSRR